MKTRRGQSQVVKIIPKHAPATSSTTTKTRKTATPKNVVRVGIQRDPTIEASFTTTTAGKKAEAPTAATIPQPHLNNQKPSQMLNQQEQPDHGCFICGTRDNIVSKSMSQRLYAKQVSQFKHILKQLLFGGWDTLGNHDDDPSTMSTTTESCAGCIASVKQVWDLHQEIEAIQQDVKNIVAKSLEIMRQAGKLQQLIAPEVGSDNSSSRHQQRLSQSSKQDTKIPSHSPKSRSRRGRSASSSFAIMEEAYGEVEVKNEVILSDNEQDYDSGDFLASPMQTLHDDNYDKSPPPLITSARLVRKSKTKAEAFLKRATSSFSPRRKKTDNKQKDDEDEFPYNSDDEFDNTESEDSDFQMTSPPPKKKEKRKRRKLNEKLVCSVCGKSFQSESILQRHDVRVHQQVLSHECDQCHKKFFTATELKAHMASHDPTALCCSSCGRKLSSARNLAIHEVIICNVEWETDKLAKLGLKLRTCEEPDCGKKFAKVAEFKRHAITHMSVKPFSCSKCGKTFKHKLSLELHTNTICGSDDSVKTAIRTRRSMNAKKPKPFRCQYCPKRFITRRVMEYHQTKIHPCNSKVDAKVLCSLCGNTLRASSLRSHIRRVHDKDNNHICPLPECSKTFFTSKQLKAHISHHHFIHGDVTEKHTMEPERKYKCSLCPLTFAHPSTLCAHKARVHLTQKQKYQCPHCDFNFHAKPDLVRHAKTHSRPGVDCSQCGRHFKYEFHLRIHQDRGLCFKTVRTRSKGTGNKKSTGWCDRCGKVVASNKWLLKRHIREAHAEDEPQEEEGDEEEVVKEGAAVIAAPAGGQDHKDKGNDKQEVVEEAVINSIEVFMVPDLQSEVEVNSTVEQDTTSAAVESIQQ